MDPYMQIINIIHYLNGFKARNHKLCQWRKGLWQISTLLLLKNNGENRYGRTYLNKIKNIYDKPIVTIPL